MLAVIFIVTYAVYELCCVVRCTGLMGLYRGAAPVLLELEVQYADRAIQFRQEFEDQSFHDRRADAAAPGPKTPPLSFT